MFSSHFRTEASHDYGVLGMLLFAMIIQYPRRVILLLRRHGWMLERKPVLVAVYISCLVLLRGLLSF